MSQFNYYPENYTMLCDFYELTMANGYFVMGMADRITYFDIFFREIPDGGGFAIAAGLEQIIDYVKNLHFTEDDIEYLRDRDCFDERFLEMLRNFRFTGDIWAVPEGTPIFPSEPVITVRAPAYQAQFIETYLLLVFNHQSLVATKANRIVRAAEGRPVSEFGSRRAQGASAAILGARAAYIGGCSSTACAIADERFGIPAVGTMAHSWVQMFDSEYEAFDSYCKLYPNAATLLVDTYNVYIIRDTIQQGACIDSFGVGERLITSKNSPVFGGVYKLAAIEREDGTIVPKIKISENTAKITNPHYKKLYRIYEGDSGKAIADLITVHDEVIDTSKPLELFDPEHIWKRKMLEDYRIEELQKPIFLGGKCVYESPTASEIRDYCAAQLDLQWDEVKRFENPHNYYVDLSQKLWDVKQALLSGKYKA